MNKTFFLISVVTSLMVFIACGKSPCARSIGLRFALAHFTVTETDTVVLKKYVKGSSFNTIVDSVVIDSLLLKFFNRNDTLFPSTIQPQTMLSSQYDYRLSIPSLNKTYSITDIIEEEKSWKHSPLTQDSDCINPITGYTLDGQALMLAPFNEVVYVRK